MDRRYWLSYWLSFAVLLLFQDPAALALGLQSAVHNKNTREGTHQTSSHPDCDEWEVVHGSECICATNKTSRCTDKGGMVCDTSGRDYDSSCQYSLDMCQGLIPLDTTLSSCGYCSVLNLVKGLTPAHSKTVAAFRRMTSNANVPIYVSTGSERAHLFYNQRLQSWAIGIKNSSGEYISRVQYKGTKLPQDSFQGMLEVRKNGTNTTWVLDPSLRFECSNGDENTGRKKFIIALITALVIGTTATTTTLHVVQAKRGCLYYPSVCHMRDEIKKHLQPEVTHLRDSFIHTYGDPGKFKSIITTIQTQFLNLRDNLVEIEELQVKMNFSVTQIDQILGSLKADFPDFSNMLDGYNKWTKSIVQQARMSLIGADVELSTLALTIESAVSVTSRIALAASVVGAIVAVGFGIVDVVQSVQQEKQARDQLRKAKSKLESAKSNIITATHKMEETQKKLCQTIISYFYNLGDKGANYNRAFLNLKNFLTRTYFFSHSHNCNSKSVYGKSTYNNLHVLSESALKPILLYTYHSLRDLKYKISEVTSTKAYLNSIMLKLKYKRDSPSEIFKTAHARRPPHARDLFSSLFSVLKYAAEKLLPHTTCFWGYNLNNIRSKHLTERNFNNYKVCPSPEIGSTVNLIKVAERKGWAPCRILRQIKGDLFDSNTRIIQFIANHVLSKSTCYWGFDLRTFRSGSIPSSVSNANVTSSIFAYLKVASKESTARTIMCKENHICDRAWQTFVLCNAWHGTSKTRSLQCNGVGTHLDTHCIPSSGSTESCVVTKPSASHSHDSNIHSHFSYLSHNSPDYNKYGCRLCPDESDLHNDI